MFWTATKSASLTSAGWAGAVEMLQFSGVFQRLTSRVPRVVGRVEEDVVGALAVPDLAAGVAGVGQEGPHGGDCSLVGGPVGVALGLPRGRGCACR